MRLNKVLLALACCSLATAMFATQAQASIFLGVGDLIQVADTPGRLGNGGEFQLKKGPTFTTIHRTFCAELTETINLGQTYKVGGLTLGTVMSGKSLTLGAARLFRSFYDASLATPAAVLIGTGNGTNNLYRFNGTDAERAADGRAMQLALWNMMGFSIAAQDNYNTSNTFNMAIKAKADNWIAYATAFSGSNANFFGVRIVNIVGTNGTGNFQDQLTVIPEPGSLLIWSLVGLGFATMIGKRIRD